MNIKDVKNNILNGKYDNDFIMLYGDSDFARERYSKALKGFVETFGEADDLKLFSAP